jgi:hypothetical protein
VRDDAGYWRKLEDYLRSHSSIQMSHGLCPDCVPNYFPHHSEPKPPRSE